MPMRRMRAGSWRETWNEALETKSDQELVDYVEAHRPYLNQHTQAAIERCWERMLKNDMVEMDMNGRMFFVRGVSKSTLAGRNVSPDPMPLSKRRRGTRPG